MQNYSTYSNFEWQKYTTYSLTALYRLIPSEIFLFLYGQKKEIIVRPDKKRLKGGVDGGSNMVI